MTNPHPPAPPAPPAPTASSAPRKPRVGAYGYSQDDLPPLGHGHLDLHAFFHFGIHDAEAEHAADQELSKAGHEKEKPQTPQRMTPQDGPPPSAATSRGGANSGGGMELEIGSGKGTFLAQQAGLQPGTDFLGIEWAKEYWRLAADRMRRHRLTNVRVLWADATVFVRNYVAAESLHTVHIYFPDPWPKARHHKRRTVQAPFLRELHRVLVRGGQVRLATDHTEYFEWMQDHARQVEDLFERVAFEKPASAGEGELVGTNFERKYRREGRPFHAMTLVKR